MIILSPSLSEEQAKAYIETLKKERIEAEGGSVFFEDFWGRKTLAYPIKKETTGFYEVLGFEMNADKISGFDEELRLDGKILRHLITGITPQTQPVTLATITAWNLENLPKDEGRKKNEEKRAPLRGRKPIDNRPEMLPEYVDDIKTPKQAEPAPDQNFDKERLDKELHQILDI